MTDAPIATETGPRDAVIYSPLPVRGPDAPQAEHARGIPGGFEVRDELVGEPDTTASAAAAELTEPVAAPKRRGRPPKDQS